MWLEFTREFAPARDRTWSGRDYVGNVQWFAAPSPPGTPIAFCHWKGQPLVLAPDGQAIGLLKHPLNADRHGLVRASVAQNVDQINLSYLGPDDLWTL